MAIPHDSGGAYSRLSCRVSTQIKKRAEEAAALLGQSITDFTESALADKAQAVLAEHARIVLTERDFKLFVDSLAAPAPPTAALKKSVEELRKATGER
ncbi:MAG: DUF1778 domain-containing protein [Armatimonadetes bacterium]|nr:DUF1778 domain-containing protein [Armatimonadota bacterium]